MVLGAMNLAIGEKFRTRGALQLETRLAIFPPRAHVYFFTRFRLLFLFNSGIYFLLVRPFCLYMRDVSCVDAHLVHGIPIPNSLCKWSFVFGL